MLIFLFLMLSYNLKQFSLYAQTENLIIPDSTKYNLGIALGVNNLHLKDEYLSPAVFRGNMFATTVNLGIQKNKYLHEIACYFSAGNPELENHSPDVSQKIVQLSYSYLYNVCNNNFMGNPYSLTLGAGLSTFVANSYVIMNSSNTNSELKDQAWYWRHAVNILAGGKIQLSESNSMSARLTIPVFKMVSRPENGHWLNEKNKKVIDDSFFYAAQGGRGEFIWDSFNISCNISFVRKIDEKIAFRGTYLVGFISSNRPLPLKMLSNNFMAGFDITL